MFVIEPKHGWVMSAGENYRYPERSGVFFTAGAERRHALKANTPYRKAG